MTVREFVLSEESWPAMPATHHAFLRTIVARLRDDDAVVGLAAGGSLILGRVDDYSDLDLLVIVDPAAWPGILERRQQIAAGLGPLLAAFIGDHVGEPRLFICLFGPPLVHVDLKFVTPGQLASRVEDPIVLWDRHGAVRDGLAAGRAPYPQPDLQWIEDRFWVWVHYAATKIGRGELFEVLDACAFLRARVLGPLVLQQARAQPNGVRRLEQVAPTWATRMRDTVAAYDIREIIRAVRAAIDVYRDLREASSRSTLQRRSGAEEAAIAYFERVAAATVGAA